MNSVTFRSLLLTSYLLATFLSPAASADIIHVPQDFPTIQDGINNAAARDNVLVAPGTYQERIEFNGKAITVKSVAGPEVTVIDHSNDPIGSVVGFWDGEGRDSVLDGFTITGGSGTLIPYATLAGGGILCYESSPTIMNNIITDNWLIDDYYFSLGAGICCYATTPGTGPLIMNNRIVNNGAYYDSAGGGIATAIRSTEIVNNLIVSNSAMAGGGIYCWLGATLKNNTISQNWNEGLYLDLDEELQVNSCIIWDNNTAIFGNPNVSFSAIEGGYQGEGNIDADPLFFTGPLGDFYLSQLVAGQPENSPCVDAGDPTSELNGGVTRTDQFPDTSLVDMGYHYPGLRCLVAGPGSSPGNPPLVRIFPPIQDAEHEYEFSAYGASHYGVNVTCGEVAGGGVDRIITGTGPGDIYGPHVRGFHVDGTSLPGLSFLAYGSNKWGVNVAAGDLDGDGYDEIITGAGPGAIIGPHVRGWNYDGSGSIIAMADVSYFAYGTPKWGVNVSAGDIDGDGFDEIVTGAGPGAVYGPHVRSWNVDGGPATSMPGVSVLAYGTNKYGVNVTCGDVDGDGIDEIVTGPGPGAIFGAHVRGWDYDGLALTPLPGFSFLAWSPDDIRYGAKIFSGTDLDSDGRDELLVGCGPDPGADTTVKVYGHDGEAIVEWFSLETYPGMSQGVTVAAGRF